MAGERASITGAPRDGRPRPCAGRAGQGRGQLRSARAFFYEATDQAYDGCAAARSSAATHTLLRLSATHAAKAGADAARIAYTMCGTAGIFTDHPLAQALQDALVVTQHVFLSEGTWQSAGRMLLGWKQRRDFPDRRAPREEQRKLRYLG